MMKTAGAFALGPSLGGSLGKVRGPGPSRCRGLSASGGSGQCTESCCIFKFITNSTAMGRLGVSQGIKMDFGLFEIGRREKKSSWHYFV